MGSSKLSRLPGLCNHCASENGYPPVNHKDFGELPVLWRDVHCYICGDIEVNQAGDCTTKCIMRHNWTAWDFVKAIFGVTP